MRYIPRYTLFEHRKDEALLLARIFLMSLFLIFGWDKFIHFAATEAYMEAVGLPLPTLAAAIALIMEFVVGIAILLGFYTRPLALLLAIYTLVTAMLGHRYWLVDDNPSARIDVMINFYKNFSIAGGLLLLCLSGPGRYSIDRR
ncbi:DoxX family protein [Dyella sp. M7H15-1]|uniref:DoxX family protein n=1 Tax=Dyella sp. M7H15-1 TaxID=2501295 RepID=UPI0013E8B356|nr:DoxX family protein [Dyella sp. M7H15-1]